MSASDSAGITAPEASLRSGLAYGLAAYAFWGLVPIYFKAVASVPALEIVAHRIVWSVVVLGVVLTLQRRWGEVKDAVADRRVLGVLAVTAILVGANWYIFIWAVANDKVLQASLGYFINPLVNVFLGVVFLRERLTRSRRRRGGSRRAGGGWLAVGAGELPWVALLLAFSFGLYGLLRKTARVKPVPGLMVETALMRAAGTAVPCWPPASSRGGLYFGTGSIGVSICCWWRRAW